MDDSVKSCAARRDGLIGEEGCFLLEQKGVEWYISLK